MMLLLQSLLLKLLVLLSLQVVGKVAWLQRVAGGIPAGCSLLRPNPGCY